MNLSAKQLRSSCRACPTAGLDVRQLVRQSSCAPRLPSPRRYRPKQRPTELYHAQAQISALAASASLAGRVALRLIRGLS
jgi:hypothetical protein